MFSPIRYAPSWRRAKYYCKVGLLAIFGYIPIQAEAEPIDPKNSTLTATIWQMYLPMTGRFKRISGDIRFDAADLKTFKAHIEVDMRSLDMGNAQLNQEIQDGYWFDTARSAKAFFVASSAQALPNTLNRYQVHGVLLMGNKTVPVIADMQVHQKEEQQILEGSLPIKRLIFSEGRREWQDISMIGETIELKFYWVIAKKQAVLEVSPVTNSHPASSI